jgi:hypothetical protein
MRHLIVSRVVMLLGAVLCAAAFGFVWLAGRPQSGPVEADVVAEPSTTAAALFARSCASCHTPDSLRTPVGRDREAARRDLEIFLRTHGDTSEQEDRLIADYLTTP